MDITKLLKFDKRLSLGGAFIFLFLILYPFGQIIRIGILQPIDFVVGAAAIYSVIKKLPVPEFVKKLQPFLVFAVASWILSLFLFNEISILYGLLYLIRLAAYLYFGIYVWHFVKEKAANSNLMRNALIGVSVVSAAFGWVQYFMFPDLKPFFVWGWDMHLFRLVGTFLDPTFLGLIIVLGLILSIVKFRDTHKTWLIIVIIFLLGSLAFTYSRASYLAFIAAVSILAFLDKKLKKFLLLALVLVIAVLALPTAQNHSIELFRTFSAIARIQDYQTTIKIFGKSPLFGVGYDNLCVAYQKYVGVQDFSSHACSGSDSSLLFVLATTGVAGFMVFVYSLSQIGLRLVKKQRADILAASFSALFVHSFFSNSMFYPWIMGWMVILLAEV